MITENNLIYNNILSRTSVRIYKNREPLSDEQIEALLRAAMAAPSACNRQPWLFTVVTDTNLLDELAARLPYAKMLAHAPLAIIPCGDKNRFLEGDDTDLWIQDVSAASENILLAATALGLGAVWTSAFPHPDREAMIHDVLGMPDNLIPLCVIPIGVPAKEQEPRDKWNPDRIHYNKW